MDVIFALYQLSGTSLDLHNKMIDNGLATMSVTSFNALG